MKPEVGRYDASYGLFLKGDGKGGFAAVPNYRSGLRLDGQVRDIWPITVGNEQFLLVARNNAPLQVYKAKGNPRLPD